MITQIKRQRVKCWPNLNHKVSVYIFIFMKKPFIQLHVSIFLAGFTGVLGRLITLNEGLLVWYRLLFSALTMWVLFLFANRIQQISKKDILKIMGLGMVSAIHWVCFYGSIKYSNISVGLVCFSSVGFFTALLEPILLRKKMVVNDILLGMLVMAGVYIIFHFELRYQTGIILGICSAILMAVVIILIRKFIQRMNAETLITYQMTGGFVGLTLFMPWYLTAFPVRDILPGWSNFFWLIVLSWGCSVWAFHLSANALKKISAFTVNLSFNMEPVYGILLAVFVYKENKLLGESFYAGGFLILLSVAIQTGRGYYQAKLSRP
jgi:drug/metabolite transporter (DMT)-like permease